MTAVLFKKVRRSFADTSAVPQVLRLVLHFVQDLRLRMTAVLFK